RDGREVCARRVRGRRRREAVPDGRRGEVWRGRGDRVRGKKGSSGKGAGIPDRDRRDREDSAGGWRGAEGGGGGEGGGGRKEAGWICGDGRGRRRRGERDKGVFEGEAAGVHGSGGVGEAGGDAADERGKDRPSEVNRDEG